MKDDQLLEQKALLESFLVQGPRPLSGFSFVNLFAWCDFFDFEFKVINDCLCIFAHGDAGSFLYLPPLGKKFGQATVDEAFGHMARGGTVKAVNRIENIPGNLLSAFSTDRYNLYEKPAEYVYRKEDLIVLKGNAYKSQRHDCNFFVTHQAVHSFEPYRDEDLNDCRALYERWAAGRASTVSDPVYRAMLEENRLVHERLLKFWRPAELVVRVLKVDRKIAGYTMGYALDGSTFCVYAEITDLSITGAASYIFKSFCADEALMGFSRINTMDDFAMPNVARAKKAYHPSELMVSYTVSLKPLR